MTHPASHICFNLEKKKSCLDQLEYPLITNSATLIRFCYDLNICLVVRKYDHLIFLHKTFLIPYFCAVLFSCYTKNTQEKMY